MRGGLQKHRSRGGAGTERTATQEHLVRAQPVSDLGNLCGGVAHELNNNLSVILGETDLALMFGALTPELRESFAAIRQAGDQAAVLTRQLLAFSNRQLLQPTVFNLNDLLADERGALQALLTDDIALFLRPSATDVFVLADRAQIEQVVHTLITNAREAMSNRGKLTLETGIVTMALSSPDAPGRPVPIEYVVLTISDTGFGMSDEVKAHIFEPFFTTKALGKGNGLGLASCFEIVKQSGGHMAVRSESGAGTVLEVFLPLALAPPRSLHPKTAGSTPLAATESILLTDDDDAVRQVAARMLQGLGYRVLQAASGGDALRILSSSEIAVDLLLTDVVLPHMGGRELAQRACQLRPGLRVLFASGYTNDVILQHQLVARDVALVRKPFTTESLGRDVRQVLDAPAATKPVESKASDPVRALS